MDKLHVAREQLIVAADLFIADAAPIVVHTLSGNAWDICERLCRASGISPFFDHISDTFPERAHADLRKVAYQYRNAFKHASHENIEKDGEILQNFSDNVNDHMLFVAGHDYMSLTEKLPFELQVVQLWYYAMYPEKLAAECCEFERLRSVFPDIQDLSRTDQKKALKAVAFSEEKKVPVADDPRTELRDDIQRITVQQPSAF